MQPVTLALGVVRCGRGARAVSMHVKPHRPRSAATAIAAAASTACMVFMGSAAACGTWKVLGLCEWLSAWLLHSRWSLEYLLMGGGTLGRPLLRW
jgi:hypothetical protein